MIQSSPIFTDDLSGYVKLAVAVASSGALLGGLVGYWIKNNADKQMAALTEAMNGLGRRVSDNEGAVSVYEAFSGEQRQQRVRDEARFSDLDRRITRQEGAMERLERDINDHHKEQRDLIQQMAAKQMEAVHKLELQVVALREQSNLGECVVEMGKSMERAIKLAMGKEK